MKRFLIIVIITFVFNSVLKAQEIKCNVTVNSNQIAQVEKDIFDALQKGIFEFVNNIVKLLSTF